MASHTDRQREHFNKIAHEYRQGRTEETHLRVKELIWREAFRTLSIHPQQRFSVLEPMCGFAEGYQILKQNLDNEFDYSGFDYSEEVVNFLQESTDVGGHVWHEDATKYHPKPDSFDLIMLIGGLHHVPCEATELVARLTDGLKLGGLFLNFEPTAGNPLTKLVRDWIYRRNDIFDQETEQAFDVSELEDMFRSAGLTRTRVLYPGLLAYVLYYNPYAFPILNKGGRRMVDLAFNLDRLFLSNIVGRFLSFATLSVWTKAEL